MPRTAITIILNRLPLLFKVHCKRWGETVSLKEQAKQSPRLLPWGHVHNWLLVRGLQSILRWGVKSKRKWLGEWEPPPTSTFYTTLLLQPEGTDRNQWKFCWSDTGNRTQEDASYITKFTCWKMVSFTWTGVTCMYLCVCVCVCPRTCTCILYHEAKDFGRSSELLLGRCISA